MDRKVTIPNSPLGRQYAAIVDGLRFLQKSTDVAKVFGAEVHQFRLNPPLDEAAVSAFEAKHRIHLPEDYRGFLLYVGDGGAGPAYGVFRLGEMDDGHRRARWKENNGFIGVLSLPFPHSEAWNDRTGKPDFDESKEADQRYEDAYWERVRDWEEKHYWNTRHINGALPICHVGCAYRQWLVITGSEAGNVWSDDRVDEKGLRPVVIEPNRRTSFIEWYRSWLNEAMKAISPN